MNRWLAGTFDVNGHGGAERVARALAPDVATVLESEPLRLAYTGPRVSAGQPLCLLDGEIDNLDELAHALNGADRDGPPPEPGPPRVPEKLLAVGFARWGCELLGRLRGDFALLVWDAFRGELLIARDQLGVRPFYLCESGGRLHFAGEIRHLLALLPRRPAPDPVSVAHWIALSNRPGPYTLYSGIRRLEPGCVLCAGRTGVRIDRYFLPRFREPARAASETETAARIREALRRAVRRTASADGSTGVLMSGGLDSSSVAAVCTEQLQGRVRACSAVFPEHPATDEAELINTLARELSLPLLSAAVRPGGLLASALESLAAWEMPLVGWGDFWTLPLMRAARAAGVRTMLDGDGGDQVFGPRLYLLGDRLRAGHPLGAVALAARLPRGGRRPSARELAQVVGEFGLAGALPYHLHSAVSRCVSQRSTPPWLRARTRADLAGSVDPAAWKHLDGPRWWAHDAYVLTQGIDEAGVFEHQRRRAALAGVAARHPMLDLDLVELGLHQPPRSTFDRRFSRPSLRSAMAGLLPDAIRLRPQKARFDQLIIDCLTGLDAPVLRGLLTDRGAELRAFVDTALLQRSLFAADPPSENPFTWMWRVWRLANLECWLRTQRGASPLPAATRVSDARLVFDGATASAL